MGLTGKYDFKGIKEKGAKGILLALSVTTWGTWLIAHSFSPVLDFLIKTLVNWLANKGLVVLNIGAIYVNGEFDQKAFDKAMGDGIRKVEEAKGKLTPEQIKAIDDEVIKAADRFIPYTK
jgi:hypothetical protein